MNSHEQFVNKEEGGRYTCANTNESTMVEHASHLAAEDVHVSDIHDVNVLVVHQIFVRAIRVGDAVLLSKRARRCGGGTGRAGSGGRSRHQFERLSKVVADPASTQ